MDSTSSPKPLVSVVIPVYNVEKFLAECLDSVVNQTLRDIEIICVDDESPDNSIYILQEYAAKDERIKIIRQKNQGLGGARNTGLKAAEGECITFLDSDDWLDLDYLEKLYREMKKHDAMISSSEVFKEHPLKKRWQYRADGLLVGDTPDEKFKICHCPPVFNATTRLYNREMLLDLGVHFRPHVAFEDVEFTMKVLCQGGRMVTVPGVCYHYRIHGDSITKSRQTPKKQRDKYKAHRRFILYVQDYGVRLSSHFVSVTYRSRSWGHLLLYTLKCDGRQRVWRLFNLIPIWRKPLF